MSARKLQQEIDKVNKKISEGLLVFNDTHEKLFATEITTQRDKFEADLKKEIKKLQRLRDQVKQWLGDSSIKLDKKVLHENRTKIEHAMDQFKDLEKISKIKQFSNEGLELLSKTPGGRLRGFGDSMDAKKAEACEYISEVIEKLSAQNEIVETEVHSLASQMKKAKSSNAITIQASLDEAKEMHESLTNHLQKLENVLRSLENEILKPDLIDSIRDDLDYIVESNQDEDFIDYDDFYETLNLEEADFNAFNVEQQEREEAERLENEQLENELDNDKDPEKKKEEKKEEKKPVVPAVPSVPAKKPVVVPVPAPALTSGTSYSGVIKNALGEAAVAPPVSAPAPPPLASVYESGKTMAEAVAEAAALASAPSSLAAATTTPTVTRATTSAPTNGPPGLNGQNLSKVHTAKSSTASPITSAAYTEAPEVKTFLDTIPRLLALSQARLSRPLPFKTIGTLLENSLYNCPDSFDAETPRQYTPRNVHPSSIDYPQEPMFELQSANIMKKFNDDTLFFCFYYGEGIYNLSRANAARELSRRGWVYETSSKQWFQENRKTRDWQYFDYQETWLVRHKDQSVFGEHETFHVI
ncbi:hypothetical protein CANTEDRAFT_117398 [Yamadazyma tenuis ATCC 10573]|uniref:General negative regulator of transcription subunit n=1 Tax=Candida tenuis (strain ATCC 10573 / BCRC 21748 / CBS 615 / JCM 9827 / NBRC 10315 / NRRL Y-1498 / VKM Y-70) TaxID=590646 RepID=G3AW87_CANTC|nr:uncharacterized protein CANTEDRAFT_117398 [Yamadazyma tenuis ATCC 10573]EGV66483.1 hypothetical protein CANTEDRAFT_117398 [Yamadazyma tenuis ATCC 10573]